jgi:hypothetical protein
MARQLTEEQKQKTAERREKFKAFCQRVAAMSEDQRAELAQRMPIVNPEGHALSHYNTCLILSQFSGAPTIVAGFQQWRKQGRQVCKGQSGLMIWVPIGRKKSGGNGAKPGEVCSKDLDAKPGFIPGYVFDISQTEMMEGGGNE